MLPQLESQAQIRNGLRWWQAWSGSGKGHDKEMVGTSYGNGMEPPAAATVATAPITITIIIITATTTATTIITAVAITTTTTLCRSAA